METRTGTVLPYFITNIVGCRPPENRSPTKEEIEACQPRLEEIIERVNPRAVVLLGSVARRLEKLFGDRRILRLRHPAAIIRDGGENCPTALRFRRELQDLYLTLKEDQHATEDRK